MLYKKPYFHRHNFDFEMNIEVMCKAINSGGINQKYEQLVLGPLTK